MDRGARRAIAHGVAESDTTERLTLTNLEELLNTEDIIASYCHLQLVWTP